MHYQRYLLLTVILVAALFAAGCSSTPEQPAPSQTAFPTYVPTMAPVSDWSLTPGPLGTMPARQEVEVTIQRDQLQPEIDVIFNGGSGMNAIVRIDAILYTSDGRIEEKSIERPITMGKEISFTGTRATDRVKVIAHYNTGQAVVINDALFEFKSRN
ncbi:MAG: hypothetical protein Q7J09_01475 [Methanocalculus sp.]|uniref:hypothetical protein n=1 Tax=Methanocalculus sp. TaxID=2004547 RepID=UPI002721BA99|nr:hypothetical protein [Methanocalculus sp.]MDO8842698.1 hypothetical protein [Methanocalculus sp.]MDO9538663.1 hypothetical protein [Methanocalculus sp.]